MITIGKPVAWEPKWIPGRRYFFRTAGVTERTMFEAEFAGELAGEVYAFQFGKAFEDGIRELGGADADRLIEIEQTSRNGDKLDVKDEHLLAKAREILALHWPPYQALVQQSARRALLLPLKTFRQFCVGWEGDGMPPIVRGLDGLITEEAMQAVSDLEIKAGGIFGYRLLYGMSGDGEKEPTSKNSSGSPSSADGDPATSNSDTSTADGSSTGSTGNEIPS